MRCARAEWLSRLAQSVCLEYQKWDWDREGNGSSAVVIDGSGVVPAIRVAHSLLVAIARGGLVVASRLREQSSIYIDYGAFIAAAAVFALCALDRQQRATLVGVSVHSLRILLSKSTPSVAEAMHAVAVTALGDLQRELM
eukprot:Opistho-1_new@77406